MNVSELDLQTVLFKYSSKGIILDTNVFLLYLIGVYDQNFISNCGRLNKFDKADFSILCSFLKHFTKILTTPQILSELSNLSLAEIKQPKLAMYLKDFVKVLKDSREEYIHKDILVANPLVYKFGLTDLSIFESAHKNKCMVLTEDFDLYTYLINNKCIAINFNHLSFWDLN
ncbi:MAG: hypothetical protein WC731_03110 [Candidatus Omnitrophota bacterium]|jgi:rRNA-processing protein FCF1